jgi:phage gp36-like protein
VADSTYSTVTDILKGDLPTPSYINEQKFVNDAANEIDSYVGYVYATPLDVSEQSTMLRPARLMIQRVASHLSTGRLILAIAAGVQDDRLHAYGQRMVDESIETLKMIRDGELPLAGAEPVEGVENPIPESGPMIANIDTYSAVEAFYAEMARPRYLDVPSGLSGG